MIYWSNAQRGFFRDDVSSSLPPDASPITDAQHAELLAAQSRGLVIVPGPDGPVAEPPALAPADPLLGIVYATQARLDVFARTRGYDGILSACTYERSTDPAFAREGAYCVAMRDATWRTLYDILTEVEAGTRPAPADYAEIEPELPALTWPPSP